MMGAEAIAAARGARSVLFVCLGNICRSPLAEGVFIHLARARGVLDQFTVDSCGTGAWHVGEHADRRSLAVAKKYGVHLPSIARQVDASCDFERFDLIIPMDLANKCDVLDLGSPRERTHLLRAFDPALANEEDDLRQMPDPYYGGPDGFEEGYRMTLAACEGLLNAILTK